MKPGVSISGTVLSPFGRGVPGATVVVTKPPWEEMFLRLTTDKDGRFQSTSCLDPGRPRVDILVQATGLAWAVHRVDAVQGIPPQVIRLGRRQPLEGRVVDARGQTVAGAFVWSSRQVLEGLIEWETQTDSNGRFVWYDAPITGEYRLEVFKPTFLPGREWIVRSQKSEVTITLRQP